jgi:arylsulfatase A-like enzyme
VSRAPEPDDAPPVADKLWQRGAGLLLNITVIATLLVVTELAIVSTFHWRTIASVWELQWGTLWLTPTALLAGAALVGAAWPVVGGMLAPTPPRRLGVTSAMALFGAAVGFGVSTGRHFDLVWRRVGFVGVVAVSAGFAAWWLSPHIAKWGRRRPVLLWFGAAVAAVVLSLANRWLLVRLYPAFHWGLGALTVGCAVLALRQVVSRWFETPIRPGAAGAVVLGWLGCAVAAQPTSERLAHFDNFRLLLLDNAPLLGNAVRVAGWLAPPPPLAPDPDAKGRAPDPAQPTVALHGRDLLLITLDALRADHVGAYGYGRPTTPNIDQLAAEGARFEWAYCATPHTSYSVTSLMTGKYIRPLLLQGVGHQSDTWASLLRTYGYQTAAFYPPAVFFIDRERFKSFEETNLGFEYQKKEFLEGQPRVDQLRAYLASRDQGQRLFVWVHLFGPHEPYEYHPQHPFGDRDMDRYDGEIAAADHTVGQLVEAFRHRSPNAVVLLSSDHGEEFGEHGGNYHGTSVYEEQVRVPLIVSAPGAIEARVIQGPVQTIDLLPTVLRGLGVPVRPRIRGRDVGPLLVGPAPDHDDAALAYAETDDQVMLARGSLRLVCQRKLGACRLYDVATDPVQRRDLASEQPQTVREMRQELQALNASHGQFEQRGLRAEGKGWPTPILRGLAGDGDAALEVAELLDDASVEIRRKAAETLFRLHRDNTTASIRLALERDEDEDVRRYAALTLTRLGQGASLTSELLQDPDVAWRRLAALSLAENDDKRGKMELVGWWISGERDYAESVEILGALASIRAKEAVGPLLRSLDDVRLRPAIARALAAIGDETARGGLAKALAAEPYQTARSALAKALVSLGADNELVGPLRRWLGVPDPLRGGLGIAKQAEILEFVGGPDRAGLKDLEQRARLGELFRIVVPKTGNGSGLRWIVRASNRAQEPAKIWLGLPHEMFSYDMKGKLLKSRKVPEIHPDKRMFIELPAKARSVELHAPVPEVLGLAPGRASHMVVLASREVALEAFAVVPYQDELHLDGEGRETAAEPKAKNSSVQAGNSDPNQ